MFQLRHGYAISSQIFLQSEPSMTYQTSGVTGLFLSLWASQTAKIINFYENLWYFLYESISKIWSESSSFKTDHNLTFSLNNFYTEKYFDQKYYLLTINLHRNQQREGFEIIIIMTQYRWVFDLFLSIKKRPFENHCVRKSPVRQRRHPPNRMPFKLQPKPLDKNLHRRSL